VEEWTRRELLEMAGLSGPASTAVGAGAAGASAAQSSGSVAAVGPGTASAVTGSAVQVDRAFVRLAEGLIHFRHAGALSGLSSRRSAAPPPLYLAHAGPGSSRAFEPFVSAFGADRRVVAPDMPGNGDSAPPPRPEADIAYYVDAALRFADSQGFERFDFLGSHTGAQIGCELAARHPQRIRRLVLDAVPMFTPELKARLLQSYAPKIVPEDFGQHLIWAWNFVRDQSLYFPWFDRSAANRLSNEVAPADRIHDSVADVVKAIRTYHIAYRAAFAHDTRGWLAKVRCPVLLTAAERDPLHGFMDEAAALVPGARKRLFGRAEPLSARVDEIRNFLAG
jgi:pimeloyl-ACP methyl ester carboxylesterase